MLVFFDGWQAEPIHTIYICREWRWTWTWKSLTPTRIWRRSHSLCFMAPSAQTRTWTIILSERVSIGVEKVSHFHGKCMQKSRLWYICQWIIVTRDSKSCSGVLGLLSSAGAGEGERDWWQGEVPTDHLLSNYPLFLPLNSGLDLGVLGEVVWAVNHTCFHI